MAFKHYLAQGGVELINSERTQAYIAHSMPGFFLNPRPEQEVQIHTALEDGAYESPLVDDAPWVNPAEPATHRFLGMYPLGVEGIGDSTLAATVTESLLDGATIGEARDGSRAIRVRGLLVAEDELGIEAGLTWLRAAVRTDACGSHGETCGATDLRYFLAQPVVCDPLYVPEMTDYGTVAWTPRAFGRLTVDGSPLIHRMQQAEDMPGHVRWRVFNDSQLDGARVRWGRLSLDDSTVLEDHEAILSRRNLLPNPTFALTALDWTVQQGQASRVVDAAGDTFARVINGGAEARTNWAPDPRFASAYPEQVWRSNGALEVLPSTSAEAPTVGSTKVPSGRFTTVDGSGSLYVDLTPLGPDSGDGATTASIVSFYAKTPSTLGFGYEVRDSLAQVVASGSLAPATANTWARRSFPAALKAGYSLRIIAPAGSATMLLAAPLIEVGASLLDYFDGTSANGFYVDASPQSPSRLIAGTRPTTTFLSIAEKTTYGPMVASFDLRSDTSAVVKISLISRDDGSTLSTRTETVLDQWTRYELVTPFGRSVRIQFEGQGRFDVRDVLVERASEVLPYFDGDSKLYGYVTAWTGVPHRSTSARSRSLPLEMSQPDSRWRPFIEMLSGSASSVTLDTQLASITPVEEQLEPYERNYHEVSVTSGPTIIKRYTNLSIGSAIEVEILFQAGKPWAFSNAKQLDARSYWPESAGYVDPPLVTRNLATNPAGLTGGAINWSGPTHATVTRVTDTAPLLPTAITRAGTAIRLTTTAAFSALGAYLRYVVPSGVTRLFVNGSVYVKHSAAGPIRMRMAGAAINTAGTILSNTLGATTTVQPNVWTQLTLPSRTLAQTVDMSIRMEIQMVDAVPSGFVMNATALMINEGQSRFEALPPYFEGYTFSDSLFGYSYEAEEGYSVSVRTELRGQANNYSLRNRLLPTIPQPPRPPVVGDKGLTYLPSTWTRRFIDIPAEEIASWAASVPTITLRTGDTEQFGMRIRFHPNPFGYDATNIDPSSYCGEFIVAYLPTRATVVLNGMTESVLGSVAGSTYTAADHLLYGSDGEPVTWPELECGIPYVMTVDFPAGGVRPSIELAMNRKE